MKKDDDCVGRVRFTPGSPCVTVHEADHRDGHYTPRLPGETPEVGDVCVERTGPNEGRVTHRLTATGSVMRGPGQVSSAGYRAGWDRVFGKEAN